MSVRVHLIIPLAIFSTVFIFIGTGDLRPVLIFLFLLWVGTLWAKWIEQKTQ